MGESSSSDGKIAIVLLAAALVVGGAFGLTRRAEPKSLSASAPPTSAEQIASIQVHVAGWVSAPGVVSLEEGALAADAIAAAGGLRPGARVDGVNLAAPVADGTQLIVPGPDDSPSQPGTGLPGGTGGLVAVNRATAAELETLPGVGPVLASRIVAYREQNGPFSSVEDLLSVPGIGEAKLAALRDLITVP